MTYRNASAAMIALLMAESLFGSDPAVHSVVIDLREYDPDVHADKRYAAIERLSGSKGLGAVVALEASDAAANRVLADRDS